jgi:hypothetical protein
LPVAGDRFSHWLEEFECRSAQYLTEPAPLAGPDRLVSIAVEVVVQVGSDVAPGDHSVAANTGVDSLQMDAAPAAPTPSGSVSPQTPAPIVVSNPLQVAAAFRVWVCKPLPATVVRNPAPWRRSKLPATD